MAERTPAEVFAPGEFIREELEARGWSQVDLASILGRATRDVSEIITAKRSITPDTAKQLSEAFGTSPELWMNLESAYRLSLARRADSAVSRRARLYGMAPVREMLHRQWIEPSENIAVLEKRILDFFEITGLDRPITFMAHAPRKSTSYQAATPAQLAWLFRAKRLSKAVMASGFSEKSLDDCLTQLKQLLPNPQEVRQVPKILAQCGIRFLVVEPLPNTKVDGVCFWLDSHSPVVAISLRYDRIDWFWHTLLHEIAHVKHKDALHGEVTIDTEIVSEQPRLERDRPHSELAADRFAMEFSVPKLELQNFIARVRPLYSLPRIRGFAARIHVHSGVVVGQLQKSEEIPYSHFRKELVRVRGFITASALTDGWGCVLPVLQ